MAAGDHGIIHLLMFHGRLSLVLSGNMDTKDVSLNCDDIGMERVTALAPAVTTFYSVR